MADNTKDTKSTDRLSTAMDMLKSKTTPASAKKADKKSSIKEWSAAEAAWWTNSTKTSEKPRWEVIMPSINTQPYQTESPENQSKKYPWLSLEEEAQLDSDPRLTNITRERMYKEMYWKKQERAWLDDRSNVRMQYISKQATTWSEEEDKALIGMSQALDWVREEIIRAWWKWVNKIDDMELINIIWETNPYTAQIINSVSKWDMPAEYATYFLLNSDEYKDVMDSWAKENPAWQWQSNNKKRKAWKFESFVEWAFSTVKWTARTAANLAIDSLTKYNPMLWAEQWLEYLATWKTPSTIQVWQAAKDAINAATSQWDEDVNADRKLRKWWYTWGKILWEAWLMTAATWLWWAALWDLWWTIWTKLWTAASTSKYAPQIAKWIEVIDKISQTWWWKAGKRVLWRILNWIEWWVTIQWISDLVEWELSSKADYMSSIELATILWVVWDAIWLWFKKFANPWKKITEITKGEWWLNGKQINQIENEVRVFNSTNKAENPFKIRAAEVKSQAIPQLDWKIKTVSAERDALVKNMINDWQKSAKEYVSNLNKSLKEADLGNIEVSISKSGKLKVTWGTTAWSEAEKQLKEFVDMINAQSDWWTKSLVDAIKSAKQISKEAQIAWKSTKMTKAITDFSKELEWQVKELYPEVWEQVSTKNSELSDLLWTKNKIIDLWDDYSSIAGKMNSDTDFYKFMDDLYTKWYTTEHFWNKTLWTYYTMWLRAPELLSEQAKLFYPSVPWLEEAWLKYLQKQAKQAYWWLWAIAWEEVTTPVWAWAKMWADVWQLSAANNR